jgi:hypothetical protein
MSNFHSLTTRSDTHVENTLKNLVVIAKSNIPITVITLVR